MRLVFRAACYVALPLAFAHTAGAQRWSVQQSGLDTNLRGVSAVMPRPVGDDIVVWVSGSNGVILRSIDKGKHWKRIHVAGGGALDFRGIVGFDEWTAYVMSSGDGENSRIYKTTDGGENWAFQYTDKRKAFFLDALVCVSKRECYALADPIDGKFLILSTKDGEHWAPMPRGNMPAALAGEGAFAASGTSLAIIGGGEMFFGTGGPAARVFHSEDFGRTWTVLDTPIASGNASSGIFSIGARTGKTIVAVGGDYKEPGRPFKTAAYSQDSGATWHLAATPPGGYRSAVASVDGVTLTAVGPSGADISQDGGVHWERTESIALNALAFANALDGWAVGPNGTIARLANPDSH
jgi:photosystem II stability/assembly factor-like uncharacterized protein